MQKDTRYLLWNTAAILIAYMAVAMPLPVISVFVTKDLGLSNSLGGFAVGIVFLATILTRGFSGRLADRKGGKACMSYGLFICTTATLICFAATRLTANPIQAFSLLVAGRLVLGLGESMALVGMLSWSIALLGPQRSGTVFALVGASLYGAFAAGGPLGLLCIEQFGLSWFMLLYSPLPLLGWLMIIRMPAVLPPSAKPKGSFLSVLGSIWPEGSVVCFQGVGFAALGAFSSLYFASKGWQHAGLALTCFGAGFVVVRLLFSHLPDKLGGMRVALGSLWIAASGQLLLWLAPSAGVALIGAFLTGTGCSLIYPSMGAEVIRKVRPELHGTAVGGFAMFQDVAYGATAPIVGLMADRFGFSVVFMIGFAATTLALLIATILYRGMKKGSYLKQGKHERVVLDN